MTQKRIELDFSVVNYFDMSRNRTWQIQILPSTSIYLSQFSSFENHGSMVCGVLCSISACATDGRCLKFVMNLYAQQELYLVVVIATILRRNAINCYVQNLFLRGKLYKNHSSSCYEQASNSLYGLKKGGKLAFVKFYTVPFTSKRCIDSTQPVHVKPLVVLSCFGLNGTVPYLSTGQDGF